MSDRSSEKLPLFSVEDSAFNLPCFLPHIVWSPSLGQEQFGLALAKLKHYLSYPLEVLATARKTPIFVLAA